VVASRPVVMQKIRHRVPSAGRALSCLQDQGFGLICHLSVSARVLDHAVTHCQLLATVELLNELVSTLLSGKFHPYVSRAERESLLDSQLPLVELVEPVQTVRDDV